MKRLSLSIVLGVVLAGLGTVAVASRSTSGTYTLPGSNFVTGTTISSSAVNDKFNDLATAMTGSLSRDGYGGMKAGAQIQLDDGSVAAPGLTFGTDKTAGLYRIGVNDYGFAVGGAKTHEWTSTGETVTGTFAASGAVTFAALGTGGVYSTSGALSNTDPGYTVGTSGWTQLGTSSFYYRRVGGVVYLRNVAGSSVTCSGALDPKGTLPGGYRPGDSVSFAMNVSGAAVGAYAGIGSDGSVGIGCTGGGVYTVFGAGSFLAEQ